MFLMMFDRVANRKEFSIWICQQHNQVNEKLGSSVFPCNVEDLDNTWKKGVPGCWNYVAGGEDDDAPLTSGMEKNES